MPELLLREEEKSIDWQGQENRPGQIQAFIDANAMLQDLGYVGYGHYLSQIGSYTWWFASREGNVVSGQLPIHGSEFVLTVVARRPYDKPVFWVGGTAPEEVYWEAYEVRYAQHSQAIIPAVLSQTTELFGYALPRQLELNIEPAAFKLLENATITSLARKVLHAIALEKHGATPIRSASITSFKDPEATNFEQLVVKVYLDCDSDTALQIWDDLSRDIEDLKKDLSPHEIKVLDERLGLDCEW